MNRIFRVASVAGFAMMTASADVIGSTASALTKVATKSLGGAMLAAVPEPAAIAVLGLGVAAAMMFRRRPVR